MTKQATLAAPGGAVYSARIVAGKEMTQLSNRPRFHAENAALVAGVGCVFFLALLSEGGLTVDRQSVAAVARTAFLALSVSACIILSVIALGTSSGIILSETVGRRLDILRITPLSLGTVIIGKALAVMARGAVALGLLVPVMAAIQLMGGVTPSEIAMAALIIVGDIFLFSSLGLLASAMSRSQFDRGFRVFLLLLMWLLITSLFVLIALAWGLFGKWISPYARAQWSPSGAFFGVLSTASPISIWYGVSNSTLTWTEVLINFSTSVVGGLYMLVQTPRALAKTIARAGRPKEEPKVKALVSVRRLSLTKSLSSKGKRRIAGWWEGLPGSLVGGHILQSSLFVLLLPVGLFLGMLPSYLGVASSSSSAIAIRDCALTAAAGLSLITLIAVAVEACAVMAREKARHTAELLATTPAGGPGMVVWKGKALAITQAFGVAATLVFAYLGASHFGGEAFINLAAVAGFLSALLFAFAVGASFSLCSRSPAAAFAWLVLTVFLLAPVARFVIGVLLSLGAGLLGLRMGQGELMQGFPGAVLVWAVVAIAFRNVFGRGAGLILAGALAAALAAIGAIVERNGMASVLPSFLYLGVLMSSTNPEKLAHQTLIASAWQSLIAVVALAGLPIRFSSLFLHGAKPR